jgi:hypothetical protein
MAMRAPCHAQHLRRLRRGLQVCFTRIDESIKPMVNLFRSAAGSRKAENLMQHITDTPSAPQ